MRRPHAVIFSLVFFAMLAPAGAQSPCQFAQVVDPCGKRIVLLPLGSAVDSFVVALDSGPAADHEPSDAEFTTVPEWGMFHAFVSQGPFLHVLDYEAYETGVQISPVRTINIDEDLYLPHIEIAGLAAAEPIVLNGQTVYPLYAVGTEPGPPRRPWLGTVDGRAIDISAGASLDGGHAQEAFASVLNDVVIFNYQRFYRITWQDGVGFGEFLDAWNCEDLPFTGIAEESLGLDFDSTGTQSYGVLQTSSAVSDLHTGIGSCDLWGDPTDIEIWGPDDGLNQPYVHFVTAPTANGPDLVLGFPQGGCPFTGYYPLETAPGALVESVGEMPLALALSSDTRRAVWIYIANQEGSVSVVGAYITQNPSDEDVIHFVGDFEIELGGCPSAISIRDESFYFCPEMLFDDPPGPRPDDFCDMYPTDPWCLPNLNKKPDDDD